jgi:hypothetical protein
MRRDGPAYPKAISLDSEYRTWSDPPDIMETDDKYLCGE